MSKLRLEYWEPDKLEDNPRNWRRHPTKQQKALESILDEVGWAGAALYNEKTGRLIDGHLRKKTAVKRGEKIPVLVGSWSEEEEKKILATLDPLGEMAKKDSVMLESLLTGDAEDLASMDAAIIDQEPHPDATEEDKAEAVSRSDDIKKAIDAIAIKHPDKLGKDYCVAIAPPSGKKAIIIVDYNFFQFVDEIHRATKDGESVLSALLDKVYPL